MRSGAQVPHGLPAGVGRGRRPRRGPGSSRRPRPRRRPRWAGRSRRSSAGCGDRRPVSWATSRPEAPSRAVRWSSRARRSSRVVGAGQPLVGGVGERHVDGEVGVEVRRPARRERHLGHAISGVPSASPCSITHVGGRPSVTGRPGPRRPGRAGPRGSSPSSGGSSSGSTPPTQVSHSVSPSVWSREMNMTAPRACSGSSRRSGWCTAHVDVVADAGARRPGSRRSRPRRRRPGCRRAGVRAGRPRVGVLPGGGGRAARPAASRRAVARARRGCPPG